MSKSHWCRDCKGTGKIIKTETRLVHGKKKDYQFRVDCPGMLMDQFDTRRMAIGGQDAAAGEKEDSNA